MIHTKAVVKEIKDEAERIIYAKVSDEVIDRDNEIIRLSAWRTDQLRDFLKNSGALLISHNYQSLPVGSVKRLSKKSDGLYMEAQLIRGTAAADEAWTVISQIGKIGFSVGFIPKGVADVNVDQLKPREKESAIAAGFGPRDKIRVITSADLLEISLVSVPSLASSMLLSYKSGKLKNAMLKEACRVVCDGDTCRVVPGDIVGELKGMRDDLKVIKKGQNIERAIHAGVSAALQGRGFDGMVQQSLKKPGDIDITKEEIEEMVNKVVPEVIEDVLSPERIKGMIKLAIDKMRGIVY